MTRPRILLLAALIALVTGAAITAAPGKKQAAKLDGWTLAWSDEFDGAANTPPDSSKWGYDTGNLGVNSELEYYTDSTSNVRQNGNGELEIVARKERKEGWDYTSGRILTRDKYSTRYGRIEARIKLPSGQGMWPAFWMLGDNIAQVGWPQSGEVDIMENIGREPAINHGTIHGPGYSGADGLTSSVTVPSGALSDDYHVYSLEWSPAGMTWLFDGKAYQTYKPGDQPSGAPWVFDHPFFLLLNVAVGGGWPGSPDATTTFPQTMSVDWVRVYKRSGPDTTAPDAFHLQTGTRSPRSVRLTWSAAADDVGVTGYDVFRGATKIASTTKTDVLAKGLRPSTRYSFHVSAHDAAGNATSSNTVAVRTCKPGRKHC